MDRLLIVVGLVFVVAGLAVKAGLPLGRLPGDIVIERGATTVYIPIVTSILASVVLTLVLFALRR